MARRRVRVVTEWVRHAVWWQVYPLGFLGAPAEGDAGAEPVHRLRGLEPWLDHVIRLGANGLALGPVFASETHGYDTVDHLRIDPRLGTEDDLRALVAAAHDRGIRVLLDGVFHHVGRGAPQFRDVLEKGRESAYAGWFRIDWDADGPDGFGYADFEGHRHLVALDHTEPAVAEHVTDVMTRWCDLGVDGWRLDAAYAVPPAFWRPVLERLRVAHPDVWVVGEMIHGDYAGYVTASGLDSVTQYELWKATWSALNDRNFFELAHALTRHGELLPQFLPQTFVGNHDVTRIASKLGDAAHLPHALALLAVLPGVPSIYYGDEYGLTGVKEDRAGGDDAVRPAFPAEPPEDPAELGGPDAARTLALHQELIAVRRRHPWITGGTVMEPDHLSNEAIVVRVEGGGPDGERPALAVALNLGAEPLHVRIPGPPGVDARVEAGTATVGADGVDLPPGAWAVVAV